jgi:hypothetical protein
MTDLLTTYAYTYAVIFLLSLPLLAWWHRR